MRHWSPDFPIVKDTKYAIIFFISFSQFFLDQTFKRLIKRPDVAFSLFSASWNVTKSDRDFFSKLICLCCLTTVGTRFFIFNKLSRNRQTVYVKCTLILFRYGLYTKRNYENNILWFDLSLAYVEQIGNDYQEVESFQNTVTPATLSKCLFCYRITISIIYKKPAHRNNFQGWRPFAICKRSGHN